MTIYIVEGSTGEYSDHCEWPVKAFRTESAAQERVLQASESARLANVLEPEDNSSLVIDYYGRKAVTNPYDPNMQVDYTGVRYSYYAIELED